MQRINRKTIYITLIILFASMSLPAWTLPYPLLEQNPKRLITVIGDAEIMAVPDEVIINMGVETKNKDLNTAKKENDQKIRNIFALLKKLKIKKQHIQTSHISIEPKYKDWQRLDFIAYFVRKKVVIVIKDTSKFERLLTGILENGANYIHGIQFRSTELRKYKAETRILAIKAAKQKAVALAAELGQKIGTPHRIDENYARWNYWYNERWRTSHRTEMSQSRAYTSDEISKSGEDTIALGQIKITAKVTVVFELEQPEK